MNKKLLALMGCVLIAGTAIAAEDNGGYEFHGYGRSGAIWDGVNKSSGFPRDYKYLDLSTPATDDFGTYPSNVTKQMVGRLGIENDTYWEMGLTKNFKMDDGAWAKVILMINGGGNGWDAAALYGANQIYSEVGGGSLLGDASVWAGKRFYFKRDIHVNDFFYTDYSGTGGGIDNIKTSFGTFSLGVMGRNYDDNQIENPKIATQRDNSISTALVNYKMAGLDFDFAISKAQGTIPNEPTTKPSTYESQTDLGYQALLQYNLDSFYFAGKGFANTFVQYGAGLSSGSGLGNAGGMKNPDGVSSSVASNSTSMRFGTYGLAALDDTWDLFTSVWYQMDNELGIYNKGASNATLSAVVRPVYAINKNFELQFEAGYGMITVTPNTVDKTAGNKAQTSSAYKLSLAPTFKLDTTNFFARPEVRFFVTYTGYTDDVEFSDTKFKEQVMKDMGNGEVTTGVQMEMWF